MSEKSSKKKKRKDNRVELEYWEDIEVTDPKTGEKVIKKIKITRYKTVKERELGKKGISEEIENGLDDLNIDD